MNRRGTFSDSFEHSGGPFSSLGAFVVAVRTVLTDRRFWKIQLFTMGMLCLHFLLDYLQGQGIVPIGGFVSDSLLVVPTIMASAQFGLIGALTTALLGSAISLTSEFFMTHTSHEIWSEWTILVVIVVTALLVGQREDRLRAQRDLFDLATQSADIAIWEYDFARDAMRRSANHDGLYGLTWQKPWQISTFLGATHPDDRPSSLAHIEQSTAPGGPDDYAYDFRVIWPDSTVHWLWVHGEVTARDALGRAQLVRGVLIDVTPRKELELANERLRMLYAALSECNQAVVFARDEIDLFERVTNGVVKVGTASMAWAGVFDDPKNPARPVARAGNGSMEFLSERATISVNAHSSTWPASEVAATGEIVLRTLVPDDSDELSQTALAHGWRSVASLPVKRRGVVVAAVSMYSSELDFFGESLRPLFEEMVKDLSFALDFFEDRRLRLSAELTLRQSEERFRGVVEQSVVGIYVARDGHFDFANSRAASLLGFDSADAMIGADISVLGVSPNDPTAADHPYLFESTHERVVSIRRTDGEAVHLWVSETPIDDHVGSAQLGMIDDVTALVERDVLVAAHSREVERLLRETVAMATSISEQRDPYTAGHQGRVAGIAAIIGEEMGLDANQLEGLRMAGRLHDIGKISVPAEILTRPGRLNDLERRLVEQHPQIGYDILCEIPFPWPVALVALQHHERLDGSGYPNGLRGDEILLEARIVAVADVLEAMSSHRPYRPSLGPEAAILEIVQGAGSRYDTDVCAACVRLASSGQLLQ